MEESLLKRLEEIRMLDSFVKIISTLNEGNVIYQTDSKDSEIILGNSKIKLYTANNKFYFLSEYNDDYNIIEDSIKGNDVVSQLEEQKPNNSYLILFYKIEEFNEQISKKIIKLEENEFFYKKYIFYYTQEEFESFKEWFDLKKFNSLSEILELSECDPKSESLYMNFLLRLIIKIPFLNVRFKKIELENFDAILSDQLNRVRQNRDEIQTLFEYLTQKLDVLQTEEVAQSLFSYVVGGGEDEN